jgi:serine/threonine protein kinase
MSSSWPSGGPQPGLFIRGKYRLLRRIGEGAMGEVWATYNEATSREVALKLLVRPDPQLRDRLIREARACGVVRHRNVVDIYDADETESGDPFLVMPLLSGETLASLIRRKRCLKPTEASRIARDIARGLQAAHDLGIVHRDLKPSNIFLHAEPDDAEPVVKILDFGVSKRLSGAQGCRTATGMLVGSLNYMSPEQVQTRPDIDHRVDLWTLGVVLFEMLAGVRPIEGSMQEVLRKVVQAEIPPVSQHVRWLDPGLEAVVMHCLQRDRDRRPRSAAEVATALEPFVSPAAVARASEAPVQRSGGPKGTAFTPAVSRAPDEATTVPRISKPQVPLLGQCGTLRIDRHQAARWLQHAPAASPLKPSQAAVSPRALAPATPPSYPAPARPDIRHRQEARPPTVAERGPSPSIVVDAGAAPPLARVSRRSIFVLPLAAVVLGIGIAVVIGYLAT